MGEDIKLLIGGGERILWEGKPNKKCFILHLFYFQINRNKLG